MDRLLLFSLRGAPGHVHLGALVPRPDYGGPKRNSGATAALIGGRRPDGPAPVTAAGEGGADAARTGTDSQEGNRAS